MCIVIYLFIVQKPEKFAHHEKMMILKRRNMLKCKKINTYKNSGHSMY